MSSELLAQRSCVSKSMGVLFSSQLYRSLSIDEGAGKYI